MATKPTKAAKTAKSVKSTAKTPKTPKSKNAKVNPPKSPKLKNTSPQKTTTVNSHKTTKKSPIKKTAPKSTKANLTPKTTKAKKSPTILLQLLYLTALLLISLLPALTTLAPSLAALERSNTVTDEYLTLSHLAGPVSNTPELATTPVIPTAQRPVPTRPTTSATQASTPVTGPSITINDHTTSLIITSSAVRQPDTAHAYLTGRLIYAHNTVGGFGNITSASSITLDLNGTPTTYHYSGAIVGTLDSALPNYLYASDPSYGNIFTRLLYTGAYSGLSGAYVLMTCSGPYGHYDGISTQRDRTFVFFN